MGGQRRQKLEERVVLFVLLKAGTKPGRGRARACAPPPGARSAEGGFVWRRGHVKATTFNPKQALR